MGLRDRLGGGKKDKESDSSSRSEPKAEPKKGRRGMCMYGHPVARGQKMCEHRHWVG